ncbi:hypothetical protein TROLL_35 [Bacillus phage Troll]|uniref:Uncharacterized protein n=1 Tax=Bacillus phage Troll TaxID=1382932 RepID=S5Z7Y5_9CAUD|nr:hypothetical protein TROLL_35 [Bacillus phage Troll]AGT13561.1 hypothetical protein TROLL_35 [Bacillus phage Troll]
MQFGEKFFGKLKEFILGESPDDMATLIRHYENMVDYADVLSTLLVDVEEHGIDIDYDKDRTGGYTDGTIQVYIHDTGRRYDIKLLPDDRMWGYCGCKPEDEGYDPVNRCCGNGCDWIAPAFEAEVVTSLGVYKYQGNQRDMWEVEKKWDEHTKAHRIKCYEKKLQESEHYADYYARQAVAWEEEIANLKEEA